MVESPPASAHLRTVLLTAFLWYSVAILPFDFLPLRFEGHETHRAGLTLVLAVGVMGVLTLSWNKRLPGARLEKLFIASLSIYGVTLILSTLFALSPMLALVGDLIRRMGLLTQLGLVVLVFAVREVGWRWLACGFWFAGVICAVYTLLQLVGWTPNPIDERAFGLLGAPTFTASWLVNALIWSAVWVLFERPHSVGHRTIQIGGLLLMVAALLATGGRGALLALTVSAVVGMSAFAWVTRRRVLFLIIGGLILSTGLGLFALSRIDWQTSPLANWPLISRLNPTQPDTPRAVRERIWLNALDIFTAPPLFTALDGQPDRFYDLRRWFGYGQDHFEIIHRPYVDDDLRAMEQGRPIDRAHNVFFDLLVMHGAVGLIAWLAVWLLGTVLALRRLVQAQQSQRSFWMPLLVLMIIVAHSVDLLFSFETLAGGWGAWLAVGLVLRRDPASEASGAIQKPAMTERWFLITTFVIALLLGRGLSPLFPGEAVPVVSVLLLVVVIALASVISQSASWRCIPAQVAMSATGMIFGLLLGRIQSASGAALVEIILFAVTICLLVFSSFYLFHRSLKRHLKWVLLPATSVLLLAYVYWFSETRAQISFGQGIAPGMLSASTEAQAEFHRQAALDFPLDAKLQRYAAIALYQAAVNRIEGVDERLLVEALRFGEAAVRLNPYDADALRALAEIEYTFAGIAASPEDTRHFQRGRQLEAAASQLLELRKVNPE
jgi:hypothetical protein